MKETRTFEHVPESVAAARRFATELLAGGLDPDALQGIRLMVSELATNCIRHTDSGFELTIIQRRDRVRVEATDHGAGEPRRRSPKPTDPTGRGLQIIDMLSSDWGYDKTPGSGKTVWFMLDLTAASSGDDVEGAHAPRAHARERPTVS
ncbi:MAG: ATP-binding protein [Solirubrobacteraceae bacterium]